MKLEVGKSYRSRNGRKVEIIRNSGSGYYSFVGSNSYWYMSDGRLSFKKEKPSDLISEWEEPKVYSQLVSSESDIDRLASIVKTIKRMTDTERKAALAYLNERWGK